MRFKFNKHKINYLVFYWEYLLTKLFFNSFLCSYFYEGIRYIAIREHIKNLTEKDLNDKLLLYRIPQIVSLIKMHPSKTKKLIIKYFKKYQPTIDINQIKKQLDENFRFQQISKEDFLSKLSQ